MAIDGDFVSKTTLFLVGLIAFISFPAEAAVRKYQFDVSQSENEHFIYIFVIFQLFHSMMCF